MPGYDPVRDAGGSDRSSPPPAHHVENSSRPSPSSSAYVQRSGVYYDDSNLPRRSLSGQSLDKYAEPHGSYGPHSTHDAHAGPPLPSPHLSASALPPHHYYPRESPRYADHEYAAHRSDRSPRNSMHSDGPAQPPRSASIADLIAVSEMSEAEHDRHREAHRWSTQYGEEVMPDHSMSRSSSASGGFQGSSASIAHSSSYPRISPQAPRQASRSERSPSMAHLLNEGTAGAIQDRPRSSSHSSISSHISHPPHLPPQQHPHHSSQMSPLGHPSASHAAAGPSTHLRDRSTGSYAILGGSGSGSYRVSSPTGAHPSGVHPQSLSTLNRGGSSPCFGSMSHPVERARHASQTGSVGIGPLPRSCSTSYAYTSASSSPASNAHAHLQPSPSHRFAVPEVPFTRSPESRRIPLPQSPTSMHQPHLRTSLSHGPPPLWHGDEYEASSAGMPPPPPMNTSPRRSSTAQVMPPRHPPTTPGAGIPPTPGSATSYSGYPVTPGARSLPPHTPTSAHQRYNGGDGDEESNYFPRMDANASGVHDQARERPTSLTSPHLRQFEQSGHPGMDYEPASTSDDRRGLSDASVRVRTPGSGYHQPGATGRSSMHPPPSLPPSAVSPSFGPQRWNHSHIEDKELPPANGHSREDVSPDRARRSVESMYDSGRRGSHTHDDTSRGIAREELTYHNTHVQEAAAAAAGHDKRMFVERELSPAMSASERAAPAAASQAHTRLTHKQEEKSERKRSIASERSQGGEGIKEDDSPREHAEADEGPADIKAQPTDTIPPLPRYAPTKRVSQPKQVMRPIGIEEIDRKRARCRNALRHEWEQLHGKDSREALDGILREFHSKMAQSSESKATSNGADTSSTDAKKRAIGDTLEDAEEVADHYNKRREVGIHGREESPIIALRKFNNWIKSVLVGSFARGRDPTLDGRTRPRGGRILDLGCGKGGDLKKWEKVQPSGLVGADIAAVSIEQAIKRHSEVSHKYPGDFFAFDCFSVSLIEVIPRELLEPMFDNITLQFCMHYAWEDVQKARVMLDNVSRYLRKGGVFMGTIPDSRELRDRMAASAHPEDRSFGNRYYKVVFDQIDAWPAFGNRYTFFLEDAVENVPEYVVDFEVFENLAQEVGLRCIYRKNFAEIYHEGSRHNEYGKLLERMRVVDRYGSLSLDEEMWQAATLYLGFAFEKM
ncbi:hypothetical protein NDA18_005439 [Ustilago nuda]|nr:hypothetical protein NDA18_005439 [Ustilago nuda]